MGRWLRQQPYCKSCRCVPYMYQCSKRKTFAVCRYFYSIKSVYYSLFERPFIKGCTTDIHIIIYGVTTVLGFRNLSVCISLAHCAQVETFGSMEKVEKVRFILEQMRLCMAKKDYIRTQIISKKISTKFFADENDVQQVSNQINFIKLNFVTECSIAYSLALGRSNTYSKL